MGGIKKGQGVMRIKIFHGKGRRKTAEKVRVISSIITEPHRTQCNFPIKSGGRRREDVEKGGRKFEK